MQFLVLFVTTFLNSDQLKPFVHLQVFIEMLYILLIVLAAELSRVIYALRSFILKERKLMSEQLPILLGDLDELGKVSYSLGCLFDSLLTGLWKSCQK